MHWGGSVLETMRFEKIETEKITQDAASVALTDTFELMKLQRKAERKSIFKIGICVASLLLLIFLVDNIGWLVFAMAYFPAICLLESIVLAIYGIWRKKNNLPRLQTFALTLIMLLIPIAVVAFFLLPVPWVLDLFQIKCVPKRKW